MTAPQRLAIQVTAMLSTVAIAVGLVMVGAKDTPLVMALVVATTISYTIMDAVRPNARPQDPAWVRRTITSNLVYVAVVAVICVVALR